ncbi:Glycosyltransferase [Vibrio cholerae]|uniref:glycosyltransferase n=1 Tax=Vibrio cholerae TaxID=666 RepID=UPI00061903A0|nr:glycosyltransferase [Vibrio cholerae]CFW14614.1 Glycosyltransferase [Vibrio cholerae]CPR25467.1 Glycosyltransferase [Vibrio cholerae]CPR25468.1 Glycosyltransferase [Vibrio cholerae]
MKISVIMALYKEPLIYFRQSVESTISSVGKFDYELIIIIDNPSIDSAIKLYIKDLLDNNSKVKVIFNEANIGLALSLNKGIDISTGDYIMRMDADDICYQDRVQIQKNYLENNLDVGIVGSSVTRIDSNNNVIGFSKAYQYKSDEKQIKDWRLRSICFHPTWFGRAEIFKSLKYNGLQCAQDVEFLFRCLEKQIKVRNINEPLLYYRISNGSLSLSKGFEQSIIRFCLNSVYKSSSNYLELSARIEKLMSRRGYMFWAFSRFHNRYTVCLNERKYHFLILMALTSPLHLYKLYLLMLTKLNR